MITGRIALQSTGEREPEQQASQQETFPATTVPQAPYTPLETDELGRSNQGMLS